MSHTPASTGAWGTLWLQGGLADQAATVYVSRLPMNGGNELELLMQRYVAGDLHAFDVLYAKVAPRVFAYLVSMCGSRDRADDLCQTTFLKLHRARSGWVPGAPLMPWLMAIARNSLLDDARRRGRSPTRVTSSGDVPDIPGPSDPSQELDEMQAQGALSEAMTQALDRLGAAQREALLLTKQTGLSIREAALVLGTTEMAVKLRVHRAYNALRAALKGTPNGDPRSTLKGTPNDDPRPTWKSGGDR